MSIEEEFEAPCAGGSGGKGLVKRFFRIIYRLLSDFQSLGSVLYLEVTPNARGRKKQVGRAKPPSRVHAILARRAWFVGW